MADTPANPASDPRSLNELAVDIVTDIHKLATGLAHAGAPPKITQQLELPAQLYAQVAKGLAAGPIGAQPASPGAPQQAAGSAAAAAPAGPPQAPAGPPPGPGTPQDIAPARGGIHNALMQAHHETLAAMTKAGGQR